MSPDKSIICFLFGKGLQPSSTTRPGSSPHPLGERTGQSSTGGPDTQDTEEVLTTGWGGAETRGEVPKTWGWSRGQCGGCCFFERWTFYIRGPHFGGLTFSRCVANSASNMFLYMLFDLLSFYFRFIKQILDDVALLRGVVLNLNLLLSYF